MGNCRTCVHVDMLGFEEPCSGCYQNNRHKNRVGYINVGDLQALCGKNVIQINLETGETCVAQKLVRVEIYADGVFAILNEDLNFRLDLSKFGLKE